MKLLCDLYECEGTMFSDLQYIGQVLLLQSEVFLEMSKAAYFISVSAHSEVTVRD